MPENAQIVKSIASTIVGTGKPIAVLHGARLDHRHMMDALEPIFDKTTEWQRHYLDLPGHGHSATDSRLSSQDDILNVLTDFFVQEFGGEPVAIIGESRGSYLAQGLAYISEPGISGVALIVPGGNSAGAKAHLPDHATRVTLNTPLLHMNDAESTRFERLVVQSEEILEKIRKTKIPALSLHDSALEGRIQDRFEFSFEAEMNATTFDKPSLIISGRQDSIAGHEDALASISNYSKATYALLDCAGHSLSWERPELFKALMLDWLKRMEQDQFLA